MTKKSLVKFTTQKQIRIHVYEWANQTVLEKGVISPTDFDQFYEKTVSRIPMSKNNYFMSLIQSGYDKGGPRKIAKVLRNEWGHRAVPVPSLFFTNPWGDLSVEEQKERVHLYVASGRHSGRTVGIYRASSSKDPFWQFWSDDKENKAEGHVVSVLSRAGSDKERIRIIERFVGTLPGPLLDRILRKTIALPPPTKSKPQ